nr:DUF1902 domain-containing protein [uncultured Rhodopila sp.]
MPDQGLRADGPGVDGVAPLQVQAHWDAAAEVWWAESDDLPGLVTEAPSYPELIRHIKSLAPMILLENPGREADGVSVRVAGDVLNTGRRFSLNAATASR